MPFWMLILLLFFAPAAGFVRRENKNHVSAK
jgi:hypothetical protein